MANIPRYTSRRTTSGLGTSVSISPGVADTGEADKFAALAGFGGAVANFAGDLGEISAKRQEIRDQASIADLQYQYDSFQSGQLDLADKQLLPDDKSITEYRAQYFKDLQKKEKELLDAAPNDRVRQRLGIAFTQSRNKSVQDVESIILRQEREAVRAKARNQISGRFEDMLTAPEEARLTTEQMADEIELLKQRYAPWFAEGELDKFAKEQQIEVLSRLGRLDEAKSLIESSEVHTAQEKTALDNRVEAAGTVNDEEARKEAAQLLLDGNLTAETLAPLKSQMKASTFESYAKILVNQHKEDGNPILASELDRMATDIWRGAATLKEFDAKATEYFARDDGINATEYKSVMASANTSLKQSQADAVTFNRAEAVRQLVVGPDEQEKDALRKIKEGLSPWEALLFEDQRKIGYWHVTQYTNELRNWLQDNPDKSGRDFDVFAEQLLYQYKNRTEDQINELERQRKQQLGMEEGAQPGKLINERRKETDLSAWTDDELLRAITGGE